MGYNEQSMSHTAAERRLPGPSTAECREMRDYLSERTGLSLHADKGEDLERILKERLEENYTKLTFNEYLSLVKAQGEAGAELRHLVSRLTVGETHFFRNRAQFDALRTVVLPEIINRGRSKGKILRLWSAGCSTGEEAYSIAMLLLELIHDIGDWRLSILATDINEDSLTAARKGLYRNWSFREVDDYYRRRYFVAEGKGWRLVPEIISMVSFRYLNLAEDLFPSAVTLTDEQDLIVCRNVMIYFTPELSLRITGRFHQCLREGGYLLVGHSEHSEMIDSRFQRRLYESSIVYQKTAAGARWEKGIKLRFRGSGRATSSLVLAGTTGTKKRRGVQRPPETEETLLFEKAVALYRQKSLEESLGIFRQIVRVNPRNERARYMMALLSADCGHLEEAEAEANRILEANPLHLEAMYLLALVSRIRGDDERELECLRRTVYLNRAFVLGHFQMGVFHLRLGNERLARRSLLNVLDLLKDKEEETSVEGIDGMTVGGLRRNVREMMPGETPEEYRNE